MEFTHKRNGDGGFNISEESWVTLSSTYPTWQAGGQLKGSSGKIIIFCFFKKKFNFLNLFLRQRESTSRGRAERRGDTESEAGSRLWAVSTEPDAGLEVMECEIKTWSEVRCSKDWASQASQVFFFVFFFFFFFFFNVCSFKRHWIFLNVKTV